MTNLSLMFSGGLDSYIAWHYAKAMGYDPQAIHVNLGHPYAELENQAIEICKTRHGIPITEIDLTDLYPLISKRLTNQIIPSRNLLLSTIGAMFNPTVWINALDGEANGKEHDKSYRFFEDSTKLLSFTNEFFQDRTTVTSPFLHMSKAQTIQWALDYGLSQQSLFETVSCYSGTHKKCGRCLTCYKRYVAFKLNGIDEPGYESDPLNSPYAAEISREMKKAIENQDHSRFNEKRIKEFIMLNEGEIYEPKVLFG